MKLTTHTKLFILPMACLAFSAAPAYAQLGSVTGSVSGTVNGTATSSTRINSTVRAPSPRVRVKTAAPSVRVNAPARARVSGRSYSGTHYHGAYAHSHGNYYYDHFHDHDHSHTHGYSKLTVEVRAGAAPQSVAPLLTYGTRVESRKGKDLGRIEGLVKSEQGLVTAVSVGRVPGVIPVATLSADGDVLVTSRSKKSLK